LTDAPVLTDVFCLWCDGLAFRYLGELHAGDVMSAERAVLTSGERPMVGDVIVCGSCGSELHPTRMSLVDPGRRQPLTWREPTIQREGDDEGPGPSTP
jgi:hypothetical protein